jgi:hypothetical protein
MSASAIRTRGSKCIACIQGDHEDCYASWSSERVLCDCSCSDLHWYEQWLEDNQVRTPTPVPSYRTYPSLPMHDPMVVPDAEIASERGTTEIRGQHA